MRTPDPTLPALAGPSIDAVVGLPSGSAAGRASLASTALCWLLALGLLLQALAVPAHLALERHHAHAEARAHPGPARVGDAPLGAPDARAAAQAERQDREAPARHPEHPASDHALQPSSGELRPAALVALLLALEPTPRARALLPAQGERVLPSPPPRARGAPRPEPLQPRAPPLG